MTNAATGGLRHVPAADGVLLQHETTGTGFPIVFLHGGLDGRGSFRRQRDAFAGRFRLVLRDLRGHSGSEWREPAGYSIETTEVDDLLRVLDAEGIERAHLAGHSSGGAVAIAFARCHPDRVARLVLIEPTLFQLLPPEEYAEQVAFYGGLAERAARGDPIGAAHAVVANVAGPNWEARAKPEIIAQVEASAPLIAAHLRALLDLPVTPADVRNLPAPALFLFGTRSAPFYRSLYARIGEANPSAPRRLLEGAGHALHAQRPEEVNAAIAAFFESSP